MSQRRSWRRREFLKLGSLAAAGATLPPQLMWMRSAYGQATAPKRVVLVFVGNGAPEEDFFPTGGSSTNAVFPSITEPLSALRDKIQIVSGIHTFQADSDGNSGGHGAPYRMFNCRNFGDRADTFDTALGRLWSSETPYETLLLGTMMDDGRPVTTRSGAEIYYERNPVAAFDTMFNASTTVDLTDYNRKKKVLDIGREQINRFRSQLGSIEKAKLDEHLDAIERVDNLIVEPGPGEGAFCDAPPFDASLFDGDADNTANFDVITSLHIKLIALALRCDLTRVVNFALCNDEGSQNIPSFLSQTYHGGSVHSDRGRYSQYRRFF
ncbi:MAG: DUF1552 domain-containing protein, partial [Myxococcota bacterium]